MSQKKTYRKVLEQATQLSGGELHLAVRLRVPVVKLRAWLSGFEVVPDQVFLDAVDIITTATLAAQSASTDPKKPKTV